MIQEGESFFQEHNNVTVQREEGRLTRVDFLDRRVYKKEEGIYYPSVTSILSYLPANRFFLEWLQDVGHNADLIRNKAAKEGTQVHNGIELLLKGEKLEWISEYGTAKYSLLVWQMLLRFAEFYRTYKPRSLGTEIFLWSDEYQYAGATDWLCEVQVGDKVEKWLIDFKTSNQLSKSYDLQLAAYAKALEERKGIKVDRMGVFWLKAATRKLSTRPGVYQGAGWQIKFVEDPESDFKAFLNVYEIYKLYNKSTEPIYNSYETEIKL